MFFIFLLLSNKKSINIFFLNIFQIRLFNLYNCEGAMGRGQGSVKYTYKKLCTANRCLYKTISNFV